MMTTATLPGFAEPPAVQASGHPSRPHTLEQQLDAGQPLRCILVGHLVADARVVPDGTASVLEVVLHQHVPRHPRALPVVAAWHYPALLGDPAAERARALRLASTLLAGAAVVVVGRGLEASAHQGEPALRLLQCTGVRLADTHAEAARA